MIRQTTFSFLIAVFGFFALNAQDPTVAAPAPTQDAADVISVYSDTYTSIYTDLSGSWSDSEHEEVTIGSDNFVKYTVGGAGNQKASIDVDPFPNVTGMEYLHIDYFTNDGTQPLLFAMYSNGDSKFWNVIGDGDGVVTGSWQSIDIPLSHYDVVLDNVQWVRFEVPATAPTVWLDNIYFWKAPTDPTADASLSDLQVAGVSVAGFDALTMDYVEFTEEATVPVVTATATQAGATVVINDAAQIPGQTEVVVTSSNGNVTETYTVWFSGASSAPTNAEADVISVYSDAFTTNIITNSNPPWGQSTVVSEITLGTNNFLEYAGLNYQGMEYTNSDVSTMEYVHLDYFTIDATALSFFLIGSGENAYDIAAEDGISTGEWVSLDIPLSHYTAPNLLDVYQFKTVGNGTVYLDNLYFWKEPSVAGTDVTLSDLTIDGVTIDEFATAKTAYVVDLVAGTTTVPTVDVSTTDVSATYTVTPAAAIPGTTTVEVTSADGTATGSYTVQFLATIPPTTAPVPTQAEADVISVYSDAYPSIATNLNPWWGQATVMSQMALVEGDTVLKYANLNYQGIDYTASNVSEMSYVHLDYFTTDATELKFSVIGEGENAYDIAVEDGITTGEWVSLDIPLTHYTVPNLSNVSQFKTEGNGIVYLDNLYFWKETIAEGTDASLSDITVDGMSLEGFQSATKDYVYEVAVGTTVVPTVDATTTDANATYVVTAAESIPGTTSILVTSEDGNVTETYTVAFRENMPSVAAPVPDKNAADVISVYSDAYTSIATNLNPGWGQSTVFEELSIGDDNFMKYGNLNYQGLDYTGTDVTAMEYVHLDYYTTDATKIDFYVIGGGETAYAIATEVGIVTGQWVSLDIPLTHFTAANLSDVYQFKTDGNGTVFLDNLYYWKQPAAAGTDASLSDLTVDGTSIEGFMPGVMDYVFELPFGTTTVPTVDAMTADPNATYVVTPAAAIPGTSTVVITSEDQSNEETYSITFEASIPTVAATDPTHAAENVISVYSDAYTSNATDINPNWGQQTKASEVVIASNNTLKYMGLNYQGIDFSLSDVSGMEYVHLDYFTINTTMFDFYLIGSGENAYSISSELGITTGQWVSVDIPLSAYTTPDLTVVNQFKTVGDGTLYLDNIYFWKNPVNVEQERSIKLNMYPNPAQDYVRIEANERIDRLMITDLSGKIIRSSVVQDRSVEIELSEINSGLYIVQLQVAGNNVTRKLFVQ